MGIELLPGPVGVYAALCACSAYLIVGHRSVYASQKLGPGSLTERALRLGSPRTREKPARAKEPKA